MIGTIFSHIFSRFYTTTACSKAEVFLVLCYAFDLFSPPGRHGNAAGGLMFYRRFSFLTVAPLI